MKNLYTSLLLAAALLLGLAPTQAQRLTRADFFGVIVPRFIAKGGTTTGGQRIPMAYYARVTNLRPNATYKFISQGAIATDTGGGAGNPLFLNPGGTALYTTQPSLANTNSGTFTTNALGEYTGWFAFVPTANARFSVQNQIIPTLILNDGQGGTTIAKRLGLDQTLSVLGFGDTGADSVATGVRGSSLATPKNIVALYDNPDGTGRPLTTAVVEAIGARVAGGPSWRDSSNGGYTTYVPNNLPNGIRFIAQFDMMGQIVGNQASATGTWGTVSSVNPRGGRTTPIVIGSAFAPLNAITALQPRSQEGIRLHHDASRAELSIFVPQSATLRICSLTGQVMARATVQRTASLSTEGWAKGLYMVVDERTGRAQRVVVR